MKKLNFVLLFAISTSAAIAQNGSNDRSPSEIFEARKGAILEKRFDEIGKLGTLNIQIEYIKDLTTHDKIQCVRFDIESPNNLTGTALLDTNEVNEVIGFIKYISGAVINHPPVDPNTEISFTSKYNVQLGCYWQSNNGWILFLRTEADNQSVEANLSDKDINSFLRALGIAKSQIQSQP